MRKTVTLLIGAASVAALLAITACKQFLADIEEDFSYWASEVIVADYSFDKPYQTSNDGALCIPSAADVTLTIKLRNPKNFTLVMPTSSADVIRFPGLTTQPVHGTNYTLVQTPDKQALQLTYKSGFLKDHEWSNGNIGPEITLMSADGRKFGKKFSLNIEANTPPPEIGDITIAKTNEADPHYVLCFKVDDSAMNTTIPGGKLHKDLDLVIAKEGGEITKIPLPIGSPGFSVDTTKGLLSSALPIIDSVPSGTWKVYFKTDTGLTESTLPKKYTVRLIDKKGLSSAPKEAKTLGYIPDISGADTAWKNLKQAVEGAQEGGVITVMGNVKATNDTGNNGAINVTTSLTIKGKIGTTLDANSNHASTPPSDALFTPHRIFTVTGGETELTLENLTLKNGKGSTNEYGGAIDVAGIKTLTLKHCAIVDCTAYGGGGIFLNGGVEAVLESCTITGCQTTSDGGGAIYAGASGKQPIVRIKGGLIKNNTGHITGGAINIIRGSLYINIDKDNNPTQIENNTVIASGGEGNSGGGIYCLWDPDESGELIIKDAEIKECKIKYAPSPADGTGRGAGISVYGNGKVSLSKVTLSQCGFIGETAADKFTIKQGGGICLRKVSTATIEGCTIENSTTANEGGGINIYKGSLTLSGCTFTGCEAKDGGAIFASGATVTITNCTLAGNTAQKNGGAIYVKKTDDGIASSVTISGGTIGGTDADGNKVTDMYGFGGGIYINDGCSLTLNEYTDGGVKHGVRIIGNKAGRAGGVRANNSTVIMTGCTFSDNSATDGTPLGGGGGVYTHKGTLSMTNCTLTHNTAIKGGGVILEGTNTTMSNCTLTRNEAENGGAIYVKKTDDGIASNVIIKGGTIGGTAGTDANKATGSNGSGGGIYVGEHCGLNLQDSTGTGAQSLQIIGNQAAKGKGVYAKNTIVAMKDRTQIDVNNDVYLDSGSMIRAGSVLNPPGGTAACITVPDDKYNTGTQVLLAGTGVTLANEAGKFTVTPKIVGGTTQQWQVNNTGYLQPK